MCVCMCVHVQACVCICARVCAERQWREFKERVVTGVVGDIRNVSVICDSEEMCKYLV